MIIITGAVGFIGSNLIKKLNNEGINDIVIVDNFTKEKSKNIENCKILDQISASNFLHRFFSIISKTKFIFHLGARTDTIETDNNVFYILNTLFTKNLIRTCKKYNIPIIYASSAATYGNSNEFNDNVHPNNLNPLNEYAKSKNEIDKFILDEENSLNNWFGLKLFNVYGQNEFHKNRMGSFIYHAYNQIKNTGKIKLFKSHNENFKNGKQIRDFIYVDDVVNILFHFFKNYQYINNGIYNVGTGIGTTFYDLTKIIFDILKKPINIEYIDTPEDIRKNYQYYTQANINKLRNEAKYNSKITTINDGVKKYIEFLENIK